MRESELLAAILSDPPPAEGAHGQVIHVGPGDDLAVLRLAVDGRGAFGGGAGGAQGGTVLLGVDQVVDGVHVNAARTPWEHIARKAVCRCVSDVAAMAGMPLACVIAVTLPQDVDASQGHALRRGLGHWAAACNAPLIGGDIAMHVHDGPLTIAVTVLGQPTSRGVVRRCGAKIGDRIWVTGELGGTYLPQGDGHHLEFEPRVAEAQALHAHLGDALHAMIDISDGLGRDGARIAEASGVGIEIDAETLPCRSTCDGWRGALADGEDYELCFAVGPDADVPEGVLSCPLTCVGQVVSQPGLRVRLPDGSIMDGDDLGWDHGA